MEMMRVKLPRFNGRSLVKMPRSVLSTNFLEGDFGKAVLKEYEERAEADYRNASVLREVLSYSDGVVKGSNTFAVVLVNQIIRKEGLRTATPADLEKILETNILNLSGFYGNSALVLRSESEPNSYFARGLAKQLKSRGIKLNNPKPIPLAYLTLRNDKNSCYNLTFIVNENAKIIDMPALRTEINERLFKIDGGSLTKALFRASARKMNDSGLRDVYFGTNLSLNYNGIALSGSNEGGRVVVVDSKIVAKN